MLALKDREIIQIDDVLFVLLASLTFLPLSSRFNLIRIVLVGVCLFLKFELTTTAVGTDLLLWRMLLSPIVPVCMVLLLDAQPISWSIVAHEVMRLCFAVGLIYVCYRLKVSFSCVFYVTMAILLINFAIQLGQYFEIQAVDDFIRNHYVLKAQGEWSHLDLASEAGDDFRAGSIFVNPNVYMVIPLVSLGVFLQKDNTKRSVLSMALILAASASAFLTGSRTALIVSIVILLLYFAKYSRGGARMIVLIVMTVAIIAIVRFGLQDMRALRVTSSEMGSLMVKINGFVWYFVTTNVVYWVTGSLGSTTAYSMDSEWGHLFSWYGVWGIIWYFQYYRMIWHRNEHLKVLPPVLTVAMVLVAATASVLLSMQVFPFVCALAFCQIEDQNLSLQTETSTVTPLLSRKK